MIRLVYVALIVSILFGVQSLGRADEADEAKLAPLFDGQTLKGWHKPYDWGKASVENKVIFSCNPVREQCVTQIVATC